MHLASVRGGPDIGARKLAEDRCRTVASLIIVCPSGTRRFAVATDR